MLAIIGGSGLTQLAYLNVTHREVVRTPYGEPSGILSFGRIGCRDVVFIARHGYGHTIPPHLVNYRANVWALAKAAQAEGIVSVASVGGIRSDLKPGVVVVPHQIIDYTWGRKHTYEEGGDTQVAHVDFTEPYCEPLRQVLIDAGRRAGQRLGEDWPRLGVGKPTQNDRATARIQHAADAPTLQTQFHHAIHFQPRQALGTAQAGNVSMKTMFVHKNLR